MPADNLEQVRALFLNARAIAADERAAYLDNFCGSDAALRRAVERLLNADLEETFGPGGGNADSPKTPSAPSPAPTSFPVESLPAGYRFVRELGRGGQAVVCSAIQHSIGRMVAIKIMREGPLANASSRARFDREAQVLAALRHPGIVSVLDRGIAADTSQYIVMDYIRGQTLAQWLRERAGKAVEAEDGGLLRMFTKICSAVNAAHLRGIVHRDIKPSNILVDERNEPYVLDFGLARPLFDARRGDNPMTLDGQFLGSLPWASPEQAEADPNKIDTRTDVYSLGVILYQLLTGGRFPYEVAGNMRDVLNNILTAQPMPPSKVMTATHAQGHQRRRVHRAGPPAVNVVIEAIVLKALSKRRDDRYQSAGELERDIGRYLAGQPTVATGKKIFRRRGRNRLLLTVALTALTMALVGVLIWRVTLHHGPRIEPASGDDVRGAGRHQVLTAAVPAKPPDETAEVKMSLLPSGATAKLGGYRPQRLELAAYKPAELKKSPELKAPLYGAIHFGDRSYLVVLDEPEGKDARLYVDANGNGDLTDDPVCTWEKKTVSGNNGLQSTMYNGSFTLPLQTGDKPTLVSFGAYGFDKSDPQWASGKNAFLYYSDYAYDGQITLAAAGYHAMLADDLATGDFRGKQHARGGSGVRLLIDVDSDGKFDPRDEVFDIAMPFNVNGNSWALSDVTAGGSFKIVKSDRGAAEVLPAPDLSAWNPSSPFKAIRLDGAAVNFPDDYKGKLVMLDFWATSCGPYMAEIPALVKEYNVVHTEGLEILGISLDQADSAGKVKSFTADQRMTWPQVYDGKIWKTRIAELYGIQSIPAAFLVDGDTGEILADGESLRGEDLTGTIEQALSQKADRDKRFTLEQQKRLAEADTLNQQVVRLYKDHKHHEALPLAQHCLDIRREILGEWDPLCAVSLGNVAAQYESLNDDARAEPLRLRQAEVENRQLLDRLSDDEKRRFLEAYTVNRQVVRLYNDGRYGEALPLAQHCVDIRRQILGERHPEYAQSLHNLASQYDHLGDYDKAAPLYRQAMGIYREASDPRFSLTRTALARLYSVGRVIAPFKATKMDSTPVDFPADYKGELVMLDFWATWCAPCMGEAPGLVKTYNETHGKGLEILGVSLDQPNSAARVASVAADAGMTWPQVYDGRAWSAEIADLYGIQSIPAAFLVDGDTGEILAAGESLHGENLAKTVGDALAKKTEHDTSLRPTVAAPAEPAK